MVIQAVIAAALLTLSGSSVAQEDLAGKFMDALRHITDTPSAAPVVTQFSGLLQDPTGDALCRSIIDRLDQEEDDGLARKGYDVLYCIQGELRHSRYAFVIYKELIRRVEGWKQARKLNRLLASVSRFICGEPGPNTATIATLFDIARSDRAEGNAYAAWILQEVLLAPLSIRHLGDQVRLPEGATLQDVIVQLESHWERVKCHVMLCDPPRESTVVLSSEHVASCVPDVTPPLSTQEHNDVGRLVGQLLGSKSGVAQDALRSRYGERCIPALIVALGDISVRRAVILDTLADLGCVTAAPLAADLLYDENAHVRRSALKYILVIHDSVDRKLILALKKEEANTRVKACGAVLDWFRGHRADEDMVAYAIRQNMLPYDALLTIAQDAKKDARAEIEFLASFYLRQRGSWMPLLGIVLARAVISPDLAEIMIAMLDNEDDTVAQCVAYTLDQCLPTTLLQDCPKIDPSKARSEFSKDGDDDLASRRRKLAEASRTLKDWFGQNRSRLKYDSAQRALVLD